MRHLWPFALALLVGCKPARPVDPSGSAHEGFDLSNDNKPLIARAGGSRGSSDGSSSGSVSAGGAIAGGTGAGGTGAGSFDHPVMRCGPRDSYAYVARDFRCPDGANPFRGELSGAQRARTGSKPHPGGHIIDQYDVPCSGGPVTVYVDMYGCPEAEAALQPQTPASPGLAEATEAFDRGDYRRAVSLCLGVLDGDKVDGATVECLAMTPAAMMLDGSDQGGLKLVGTFCGRAASLEAGVKLRQRHVMEVARWLARGAKGKMTKEQFRSLVGRVATACGVNDGQGA